MKKIYVKLIFLLIVALILCISLITYKNLENYTDEVQWVRHSNDLIKEIQLTFSTIKDAEIGQRGYQLTNDTVYLKPYFSAIDFLPLQFKKLDSLVQNPTQKKNLDTLKKLTDNQFIIISTIVANTNSTHLFMDRYESRILARGKDNMNAIRNLVQQMVDTEQMVYINRVGKESRYKRMAPIALLIYTVLALTGLVIMFIRILQALDRSKATQLLLSSTLQQQEVQMHLMAERKVVLNEAESIAKMGSWKWSENNDEVVWSRGLYNIYDKAFENRITLDTFLENVVQEDTQLVEMFVNTVRSAKETKTISFRTFKNGKVLYLMARSKPQEINGNNERVVLGVVVDVTESKLTEKQLKKYNNELKRSNEDLEQFAYAASHDLQEPLRKIRAFGDRLLTKFEPLLGDQGKDYIQRMQSSSARMQLLIEDLLSFSRISSMERTFELMDPVAVIKEVKEDLDIQLSSTNSSIIIEDIPQFQGDRVQIKRLFQNLISNAVKFRKENELAQIKISGETIQAGKVNGTFNMEGSTDAPVVRISVKDNGIGFDQKYANKIFNIFQRLHGRMAYEGTGIGLAICKKIVANHHGHIEAKSVEGSGSEFIILIPKEYHKTSQPILSTLTP